MNQWFRAYEETLDDPKVQLLDPPLFKAWFNLLCLASLNGGVLPAMAHIAFRLRMPVLQAELTVSALIESGLFDQRDDGLIEPHNWNGRQYKSDVSTERVQRFRKRQRNAARNVSPAVSETPPDSDSDSETEKNKKEVVALARGSRLAADWYPDDAGLNFAKELGLRLYEIDNEANKFRDYWHARAGPGAVKRDWAATWRNWCRKAKETPSNGASHGRQLQDDRLSVSKAIDRLAAADVRPPPRPSLVSPTSEPDRRLLPKG
jgi:hypothetical protein